MKSRKLLYLLSVISLVIVNSLYISYQYMIVLIVVIAVGVFSFVVQKMSVSRGVLYVLFEKNQYTMGDNIKIGVKYDSRCLFPVPWAQADIVVRSLNKEHYNRKVVLKKYSMAERASKAAIELNAEHCGVIYVSMRDFIVRDYLNIFSDNLRFDFVRKTYIFPQIVRAERHNQSENCDEMVASSLRKRENDEIIDLRNYQEGDALNRIHWNLSSVYDEYIVKQYAQNIDIQTYICADLTLNESDTFIDDLDKIYQWVYSVATRVVECGGTVILVAWDESKGSLYEAQVSELEVLDESMEHLLEIKCSKDALLKLDKALDWESRECYRRPIVVTNSDYESDIYQIVKVGEDDLGKFLSDI